MTFIDYMKQFVGKQETAGSNRGPLVDAWKSAVSKGLTAAPIPWCACFVFAMIAEFGKLDRKGVANLFGFDRVRWYPESCDSWWAQARSAGLIVQTPLPGDIVLFARKVAGKYSLTDAFHIGFYVGGDLVEGAPFSTLEGNTVPGTEAGARSAEGTDVALRTRVYHRGGCVFVRNVLLNPVKRAVVA